MDGRVPPVIAIGGLNGGHGRLLLIAARWILRQITCALPLGSVLINAIEMERWEQMNRFHAGGCECAKVFHAVRFHIGESKVGSSMRSRHRLVGNAEIANVEFVNAEISKVRQVRGNVLVPSCRLIFIRGNVGQSAFSSVGRQID